MRLNIKNISALILIAVLLTACMLIVSTIWFSTQSYESLINYFIFSLNRPDLKNLIRESLFTRERYNHVYAWHWIIYPLIFLFVAVCIKKREKLAELSMFGIQTIRYSAKNIHRDLISFKRNEKLALLVFLTAYLGLSVYKIVQRDITYDEAWNYNYFISKPFYFSLILFNTYPLYHMIAHFFNYLPFDDAINIRLPAVLCGLVFLLLLFYSLRKKYDFRTTTITVLIAFSTPLIIIYSCVSKGVIVSILNSLVVFYTAAKMTGQTSIKKYLFIYVAACLLNFLFMPTAIIFNTGATLFLFGWFLRKKDFKKLLQVFIAAVTILLLTAFFYIPSIISSGEDIVLKASDPLSISVIERIENLFSATSILFFDNSYLSFFLTLAIIITSFFTKDNLLKKRLLLSVTIIATTCSAYIFKEQELPDRALAFLFIPYIIFIAWLVNFLFSYKMIPWFKNIIVYGVLVLNAFAIWYNNKDFLNPPYYQKEPKIIISILMKYNVTSTYIDNQTFYIHYPVVEYYYNKNKKNWQMNTSDVKSTRFKNFRITDNYDCIITGLDTTFNTFPDYSNIYRGSDFLVYVNNRKLRAR